MHVGALRDLEPGTWMTQPVTLCLVLLTGPLLDRLDIGWWIGETEAFLSAEGGVSGGIVHLQRCNGLATRIAKSEKRIRSHPLS